MTTVRFGDEELLAVACFQCEDIKLVNPSTGAATVIFKQEEYTPYKICLGDPDRVWVYSWRKPNPIFELNCGPNSFSVVPHKNPLFTRSKWPNGLCFVPAPNRAVVICDDDVNVIQAVSCDVKDKVIWEVKDEVGGKVCKPYGLLYSPKHQVLFVADGRNKRVLVLDPKDGSLLQIITLDVGWIRGLPLVKDQIVMRSYDLDEDTYKLSYFNVSST